MSIRELLKGIDETETQSPDGWWETSKGSEFGSLILNQALDLESKLQAESQALRNELDKYKKQVANDDKHLEKASFVELERDQLRNELEALRGTTMGVDLSKDYINKIKANAVRGIKQNAPMTNNGFDGFYSYSDIIKYANKLEQDND